MLAIDIDDTLTDTALRVIESIKKLFGHQMSAEALRSHFMQPGIVPQWQKAEVQLEIKKLFESSDFLSHLDPKPGSPGQLHEISQSYPLSCYITSRSSQFHKITQSWLHAHHFPRAPLVTRSDTETRQDWKLHYLSEFHPQTRFLLDDVMVPQIHQYPALLLLWLHSGQQQVTPLPSNVVLVKSLAELPNILAEISAK
jgi:hypothetical protein